MTLTKKLLLLLLPASVVGSTAAAQAAQLSPADVESSLISELAAVLQSRETAKLDSMRPLFASLPKNAQGNLGEQAARQALRQWAAQQHGWDIAGLEEEPAAAPGAPGAWVVAHLQGQLEQRHSGRGVGLRELAALAAALESLVGREATLRLTAAYDALGLATTGRLGRNAVVGALQQYLAESPAAKTAAPSVREAADAWLRSVKEAQTGEGLDFASAEQIAMGLEERLGRLHRGQCSVTARCMKASSFHTVCCSGEEAQQAEAGELLAGLEPLAEALAAIPLWVPGLLLLLNVLVRFIPMPAPPEGAQTGTEGAEGEQAGAEAEKPEKAQGNPGRAAAALVLLLVGATAAGLLDVTVLACALTVGLALVLAARLVPQKGKAKAAKGKEA